MIFINLPFVSKRDKKRIELGLNLILPNINSELKSRMIKKIYRGLVRELELGCTKRHQAIQNAICRVITKECPKYAETVAMEKLNITKVTHIAYGQKGLIGKIAAIIIL